jgi:hypothetical protein
MAVAVSPSRSDADLAFDLFNAAPVKGQTSPGAEMAAAGASDADLAFDLFGDSVAPVALPPLTPPTKPDEGNSLVYDALVGGAKEGIGRAQALFDPEGGKARVDAAAKENPLRIKELFKNDGWGFNDKLSVGDIAKGVGERFLRSVPEMAAVTGATVGAVAAAPVTATAGTLAALGLGAGFATSLPFQAGGNLIRQIEETGETTYGTAVGLGMAQAAMDSLVPFGISKTVNRAFGTTVVGAVSKKLADKGATRIAGVAGVETATEVFQSGLEQYAGNPENLRILTNPANAAEEAKQRQLINELLEAAIVAAPVGAAAQASAESVRAARGDAQPERKPFTPAELLNPDLPAPEAVPSFDDYLNRTKLTDDYLRKLMGAENNTGDPGRKNPDSSATGNFQFTARTWLGLLKEHRPDIYALGTRKALALRANPNLQNEMIVHFTDKNRAILQENNLPVSNATLGIMHRFGDSGGVKVLNAAKANPDAPLAPVVGEGVMKANKDLRGKTAGGIIQWYEQRLGQGLTYTGKVAPSGGKVLSEVQTAGDQTGIGFDRLASIDAADIAAQAMVAQANAALAAATKGDDAAPTVPQATQDALRKAIETASKGDTNETISMLQRLADGTETLAVPELSMADIRDAAEKAVADLGLLPRETPPGVPPGPTTATFDTIEPDALPRWQMANDVRRAFTATVVGDSITPETGGNALDAMLELYAEYSDSRTTQLQTESATLKAAPRRAKLASAVVVADAGMKARRARAALQQLMTPVGSAAPRTMTNSEARNAILDFMDTARNRRNDPIMAAGARGIRNVLRQFNPRAPGRFSTGAGKGFQLFDDELRGMRLSLTKAGPDVQFSPPLQQQLADALRDTDRNLGARATKQVAAQARADAARDKLAQTEAEAVTEAAAAEQNQWEKARMSVANAQLAEKSRKISNNNPTVIALLNGDPLLWNLSRAQEPTIGWTRRQLLRVPGARRLALLPNPLMRVLPTTVIDRAIGRTLFNNITIGGVTAPVGLSTMREAHSGDAARKRVTSDTQRVIRKYVQPAMKEAAAKNDETVEQALERMSYQMASATQHEVRLFGIDGTMVTPASLNLNRADYNPQADPNKHHVRSETIGSGPTKTTRYFYDPNVVEHLTRLVADLDAMTKGEQIAYRESRDLILAHNTELLVAIVNNARDEAGLGRVQTLAEADAVLAEDSENLVLGENLTVDTRKMLKTITTSLLRGDYFPLSRAGEFSLFARQEVRIEGATAAAAEAAFTAAKKQNIHLRPLGESKAVTAVRDGNVYVVPAEVAFYAHYNTEAQAEVARAALVNISEGATPSAVGITDPEMQTFKPTFVGSVFSLRDDKPNYELSGLSPSQAAALQKLTTTQTGTINRELRNLLLTMLPDRQMAASLKKREQVLGAPPNFLQTLNLRQVKMGNQLSRVYSSPKLRAAFGQIERQIFDTKRKADAATTESSRRELQALYATQKTFAGQLEERMESEMTPFLGNAVNGLLSRFGTIMFLTGISNIVMNMTQVSLYGTGQFAARYGAKAAARLQVNGAKSMKWVITKAASKTVRERSLSEGEAYFSDAHLIDMRHFADEAGNMPLVTDPNMPVVEPNLAVLNKPFDEISDKGLGALNQFALDADGRPQALYISEMVFDLFKEGSLTWEEVRSISKAFEGRHLGSTFFEQTEDMRIAAEGIMADTSTVARRVGDLGYRVGTFAPSMVEFANRLAVVLTAHEAEVALRKPGATLSESDYNDIEASASDLNSRINVDYSTVNRAPLQRRAGVLMQFTTFAVSMASEAAMLAMAASRGGGGMGYTRREAAIAGFSTFMLVGAIAGGRGATPFFVDMGMQVVAGAMGALFGDEEDADEDDASWADRVAKYGAVNGTEDKMRALFGDTFTDVWLKGPVSMATGAALQDRMGGHLPPVRLPEEAFTSGKQGIAELALMVSGPVGQMVASMFEAYSASETQGVAKTAEAFMPKAIRDLIRTYRFTTDGVVDRRGNIAVTPEELAEQNGRWFGLITFLGFSLQGETDRMQVRRMESRLDQKRKDDMARVIRETDLDNLPATVEAAKRFNRIYPDQPMKGSTVGKAMKSTARDQAMRRATGGLNPRTPRRNERLREIKGLD